MHLNGIPVERCLIRKFERAVSNDSAAELGEPFRRTALGACAFRCSMSECPNILTATISGEGLYVGDGQMQYYRQIGVKMCQLANTTGAVILPPSVKEKPKPSL